MKERPAKKLGQLLIGSALLWAPVAAGAQGQMALPAHQQAEPAASSTMGAKGGTCCGMGGMSGMKKKSMTAPRHGAARHKAKRVGAQHKTMPATKQPMPMKDDM